ncbi:MAG: VanW family protein [Patescibacteria group bacterium]|jgi:vancomycin resistance protein VanW
MQQPIKRSKARLLAGRTFYTLQRYFYWYVSGIDFATKQNTSPLPFKIFTHKTPLRRALSNVDPTLNENKIANLKIAIQKLDGIILEPGQTYSHWRLIGHPTKRKGYKEGMVLDHGTVKTGTGGGLCQLSNLIYWMTLHTPLSVTERWRHSYDVFPDVNRVLPFGSGATCAYPNIDLQIKNQTSQRFQLSLQVTEDSLVGTWLSDKPIAFTYHIAEIEHEIKHEWWGQYSRNNKIARTVVDKQTGKKVSEELVAENHAIMMYEPLLGK